VSSSASSPEPREHRDSDRPSSELPASDDLSGNVVPLRPTNSGSARLSDPAQTPSPDASPGANTTSPDHRRLAEADPGNSAHQPSPIFGRATLNLPEWPLVLVCVGVVVGLGVAVVESFRLGSILFGCALVLAFFLRLVLTDREAGMLKVRSRLVDLVVLGALATGMLVVSLTVPV
jgi:hypothetical protein